MNKEEIVFDKKSGISLEEQQEILSQINGIAEKNRRLLSQTDSKEDKKKGRVFSAQKNNAVFPLAVNIAAVVMLVCGAFLLVSFNGKKDAQVRTGNAVYNLTERSLIEEIRKDTAEKIAAKDREIESIKSRLNEIGIELSKIYSGSLELTTDQVTAQERLLAIQNAFLDELAGLQDERSQILETSRSREARLRAQLDERTREFAVTQQKTAGELDFAASELDRLTTEQEKIAAIDAQISGGLAAVKDFIQKEQYDQASGVAVNLRRFCNNNSLASSRVFQSRRDFYNQSIDFVEVMINDARKNSGSSSGTDQFELRAKNVQLQNSIDEMQKTIDALSSGGSGSTRRINELEANISTLQKSSSEKDSTISRLETENSGYTSEITQLRNANTTQEQEMTRLRNQVSIAQKALQDMQALQE
jgi:predicted  nucleic acid-binding Zn-ribbon protein